ncbi:MAG TPA: hypothetical protein P5572_11930, partial [Phycisphaerae bacterium]|nr:hypothetical protein [Phycisphaerae bacterium]
GIPAAVATWNAEDLEDALAAAETCGTIVRDAAERRRHPQGYLGVMGLSAGTAVVVSALELLPNDVQVDYVVLFEPSISATRNLAPAMRHVRGKLYATCSANDGILGTLLATADGGPLPPAGKIGFRVPLGLPAGQRPPYARVVNLPWRSKYRRMGWNGGHVSSTTSKFVELVIAPRMLQPLEIEAERHTAVAASVE